MLLVVVVVLVVVLLFYTVRKSYSIFKGAAGPVRIGSGRIAASKAGGPFFDDDSDDDDASVRPVFEAAFSGRRRGALGRVHGRDTRCVAARHARVASATRVPCCGACRALSRRNKAHATLPRSRMQCRAIGRLSRSPSPSPSVACKMNVHTGSTRTCAPLRRASRAASSPSSSPSPARPPACAGLQSRPR